jgi:hypothetical protein
VAVTRPPEPVGWDDVVLPAAVVDDLRALLDLMKRTRGGIVVPAPTGLILVGPPGTGKHCSSRSRPAAQFLRGESSDVWAAPWAGLSSGCRRSSEERRTTRLPSYSSTRWMACSEHHGQMNQHDVQLVEQALIEISALART